jgi:hypothetical protein
MRQDDMVENMEKLAWDARGRRFQSYHPDSFIYNHLQQICPYHKNLKTANCSGRFLPRLGHLYRC